MPIEINELVIRATIEPEGAAQKKGDGQKSGKGSGSADVVAACVEQVLEILQRREER